MPSRSRIRSAGSATASRWAAGRVASPPAAGERRRSRGGTSIRAMTAILGLNAYHGDASAALVIDGELVAAAEEERFNRLKHVAGFPTLAAGWCLEDAGLSIGDVDHVAIGRDPRANLGAKVVQTLGRLRNPRYVADRMRSMSRVRSLKDDLAEALGTSSDGLRATFHNVEHHQAHAASAFFVSPFD